MKTNKLFLLTLCLLLCTSCWRSRISGIFALEGVDTLIVKSWEGTYLKTLDTLVLKDGRFTCDLDVKKGDPRFVYLYKGDKVALPLCVKRGDKIRLSINELGGINIEGSFLSEELYRLFIEQDKMLSGMAVLSQRYEQTKSQEQKDDIAKLMNRLYLEHYRARVRFIVSNPYSICNVAVLNETLGPIELFSRSEDAFYFQSVADSLERIYPNSTYVKILKKDAQDRMAAYLLTQQIQNAGEIAFPEILLPGLDGKKVSLTEVAGKNKMTVIYFWDSSVAANNVFNSDYLKKIYEKYHRKGLEVYAISLDRDKPSWARACRDQDLSWYNVCDGLGVYSSVLQLYNVKQIPTLYFIYNGSIIESSITKPEEIEPLVKKYL